MDDDSFLEVAEIVKSVEKKQQVLAPGDPGVDWKFVRHRCISGVLNTLLDLCVAERITIHTSHISVPLVHQTQPNT